MSKNKGQKKGSNINEKKDRLINDKYLERSIIEEISKEFHDNGKSKK